MKYIHLCRSYFLSNVTIFLILSVLSAMFYSINSLLSLFIIIIAIAIFMRFRLAVLFIILIILARSLSSLFFIVLDVEGFGDNRSLFRTSSASIIVDKDLGDKIGIGTLIISDFKLDNRSKKFYRPKYYLGDNFKLIKLPIVTKVLDYRNKKTSELFYLTGGRVSVSQALVFGDRRYISKKINDEYIITGLAHILSISGMHVGVITAIIMTLLFFFHTKIRFIFATIALLFLILFGGFAVTVLRSVIFAIILMVAYIFDYMVDTKRFVIALASMFIAISPSAITDISFLLSFAAVFGIFYLLGKNLNPIASLFMMGIAATLYTAPLSLYIFNTTNHLSIISTIIMTPIIYAQIFITLFTLVFTSIGLPALIIIEEISNTAMQYIYDYTYFAFVLKSIPLWVLLLTIIYITITLLSKYKYLSLFALLIIFYPAITKPPDYIFPNLYGSSKGFLSYKDNYTQIYFAGTTSQFKYIMLPVIARYGIKKFDYGSIKIFDGINLYIKTDTTGMDFTNICINDNNICEIYYHTKSNSIKDTNYDMSKINIIYKNKFIADNIFQINKTGELIIDKGKVKYYDKNQSQ